MRDVAIALYSSGIVSCIFAYAIKFLERNSVGITACGSICPYERQIVVRIKRFKIFCRSIKLYISVVRHRHLALLCTFCGHKDNAVSSARTIDGGRRGILQHVNALNLI